MKPKVTFGKTIESRFPDYFNFNKTIRVLDFEVFVNGESVGNCRWTSKDYPHTLTITWQGVLMNVVVNDKRTVKAKQIVRRMIETGNFDSDTGFVLDNLPNRNGQNGYCAPYVMSKLLRKTPDEICMMINRLRGKDLFARVAGVYTQETAKILRDNNIELSYIDVNRFKVTLKQLLKERLLREDGVYVVTISRSAPHIALVEVRDGRARYYDNTHRQGVWIHAALKTNFKSNNHWTSHTVRQVLKVENFE